MSGLTSESRQSDLICQLCTYYAKFDSGKSHTLVITHIVYAPHLRCLSTMALALYAAR